MGRRSSEIAMTFRGEALPLYLRAIPILVVLAALFLLLGVSSRASSSGVVLHSAAVEVPRSLSVAFSDEGVSLEGEELAVLDDEPLPPGFSEEVMEEGEREWMIASNFRAVGYHVESSSVDALSDAQERLEGKGWTSVPSGSEGVMTFIKNTGRYRWLGMVVNDVGRGSTVVMTLEAAVDE